MSQCTAVMNVTRICGQNKSNSTEILTIKSFGKVCVGLLQLEYTLINSFGHHWPFLMPVSRRKCQQTLLSLMNVPVLF